MIDRLVENSLSEKAEEAKGTKSSEAVYATVLDM